ncbi:hypothetical protein PPL_08520 [Heterostelium album PN500]|uniref:PPIase cyclophilin-type domain-containing protein n=1 Tax=Heterostelium pallidum (strain ATCC 26659 / Pp 5 / PN500) TaxID=670386 RepID=D3BIF0_HETP5|nr:hypothetical protein PPL_08520 [Heterostelium album PN500]EFA79050.1 hypothetical protein PPL_08520 [Heterostelium album PN500]|eukprot:XP_020431173.1 hypothetical protein PPL_08520 [Heterostelium album PN500]
MAEPTTNGKIILKTTLGDIEVELWSKEAPKTGDPTGTGEGGESVYGGEPFKDEYHSRLRFSRRGMLGMASASPDSNQSQFFITLDAAESLTKKHTLFGKIVGDTIFNILKVNEIELDENERPLFPPKIITTDVVYNPFDDIEPRQKKTTQSTTNTKKKKAIPKNLGLLSFGDEEPQDEIVTKKSNNNNNNNNESNKTQQKHSTTTTTTTTTTTKKEITSSLPSDSKSFEERMRESIKQKSNQLKRDREDENQTTLDNNNNDNKKEDDNKDEESVKVIIKPSTKEITVQPPKEKKKKIVGSLSFKKTTKRGDDPIAPPRVKKQQDSHVLEKLNSFKKSLAKKTENEDDDWKTHKLVFSHDPSGQDHYM